MGGPRDKPFEEGGGEPSDRLGGPGEGAPRLMLELVSSSLGTGLCDVSLSLLELPDSLLLPPFCECRE